MNSVSAWLLDTSSAACKVEFQNFVFRVLNLAENCRFDSLLVSVVLSLSVSVVLFNCTKIRHRCTPAHLLSLSSDLSDSLDHSPNACALAQGLPENRVAFDMAAERL